jgi:hypothetical protein
MNKAFGPIPSTAKKKKKVLFINFFFGGTGV